MKFTYKKYFILKHESQICKNTQDKVFSSLLDSWLSLIPKWFPLKASSPVILVLLTLKKNLF